jgi:anti-sigma B factor antagonist
VREHILRKAETVPINEIRVDSQITHVALVGRLDVAGLHAVDVKFHAYTAARKKPTLVDLSGLEFIASLGMGMLISCAKSLERNKVKMVLLSPIGQVEEALKAVGIDQVIPIARSTDEAMALLFPGTSTP